MVTVGQRPWLTMTEIAALKLPDMPDSRQGVLKKVTVENWLEPETEGQAWRHREGQGGGMSSRSPSSRFALRLRRRGPSRDCRATRLPLRKVRRSGNGRGLHYGSITILYPINSKTRRATLTAFLTRWRRW
ncbi:hypothetical protein CGLAMM_03755 [Acetobacteraceae bacterium EV16G]